MKTKRAQQEIDKWNQHRAGRLMLTVLLTLTAVLLLSFIRIQKVSAAELNNTYALSFSTGASGTKFENFQYIAVHYTDTSGTSRTHYMVTDLAEERSEAIITAALEQGASANLDEAVRKQIEGTMNYTLEYDSQTLFDSYTQGVLYFQPDYSVASVTGVDFLTKKSDKWSCEGLHVYKVDEIYGTRGLSYVSGQTYQEFRGELLFGTTGTDIASLSWTDFQLIRFGSDSRCTVKAATVKGEAYDNRQDSEYLVRLDIADEYLAGLESLAAEYQDGQSGLAGLKEAELLKLRIVYRDIYGARRVVTVPVISNVIGYALEQGISSETALLGLAGQGESLYMKVRLPDFAELYSGTDKFNITTEQTAIYLTCGGDSKFLEGMGLSLTDDTRSAERKQVASDNKDALALSSASLYNVSSVTVEGSSAATATMSVENNILTASITGDPLYYHVAANSSGDVVTYAGSETTLSMNRYQSGDSITLERDYEDKYLVELNTDVSTLSGTTDNLKVEFSYMDQAGTSRISDAYDMTEMLDDFYGYWPSSGADYAYLQGATAGGVLRFVFSLANVDYFTGIRVTVDGNDEWQMGGMKVYKLYDLSQRVGTFKQTSAGGANSNVVYTREYDGVNVFGAVDMQMLVEKGQSKEFSFTSTTISSVDKFDWSDKKYALTYDEANNDLGFTDTSNTYTVEVNVASDAQATYSDGDSGSKNQFFFRLQFENGSSPYVLANQQMTSDGFRAGQTETFTISTNEDYGDVTAVQIIPEMKNSEDYTYDKLNIDSIRVVQNSSTAMSKTWTISSVGWIGTDYTDPGEENGLRSSKTIYESQLAKTYKVDYSSNVTNLLFCLGTGSYKDANGNEVEQFQGKVDVTVQYISITGESKTATYDIVKYMYDYMGRTPNNDDSGLAGGALSDPNYMFRGNHMDRFILPISDIKTLTRVDFYPTSSNGTSWQISSLGVYTISDKGFRYVNENDEIVYTGKTAAVCSNAETINLMVCPKGSRQEGVKVNMTTDRQNIVYSESNKWVSVVSREPISSKDTLNIYLYMRSDADDKSSYDLAATVEYTNVGGMTAKSTKRVMNKNTDSSENMFYLQGVDVKQMSVLNNLDIDSASDNLCYAPIDYAMVQRVRSGVVIDTYYIYYGGADPGSTNTTVKAGPSSASQSTGESQVVTIDFGGDTKSMQLLAENRDLAVAIKYISSAGNVGGSETEYSSPYIFLTDQEYTTLYNGQSVDITFHEKYVKEITGIELVPSGQVAADITGAVVTTYQQTDVDVEENILPTAWYSFPGSKHVEVSQGNNTGTLNLTDPVVSTESSTDVTDVVMPVTMTIETAAAAKDYESGTNTPIRMKLYYTGAQGESEVYTVEDITKVAQSGSSFATEGTATLNFMLTGVRSLTSVTFEPYDSDDGNIAGWSPKKLTVQTRSVTGTNTMSREIDTRFYEGMAEESRIILSNIVLSATVAVKTTTEDDYDKTYSTLNQDVNILIDDLQTMRVLPVLNGSGQGFTYTLQRVGTDGSAGAEVSLTEENGITINSKSYLTLDAAYLELGSYQLTIKSEENTKLSTVVKFTIEQHKDKKEDSATAGSTTDTTTGGSTTDTTTGGSTTDTTTGGSTTDTTTGGSTTDTTTGGSTTDTTTGGSTTDTTTGGSTTDTTTGGSTDTTTGGSTDTTTGESTDTTTGGTSGGTTN